VYSSIVNEIRNEVEIINSIVPESPGAGDLGWKDKGLNFFNIEFYFC
jgi:hypothetical protein